MAYVHSLVVFRTPSVCEEERGCVLYGGILSGGVDKEGDTGSQVRDFGTMNDI